MHQVSKKFFILIFLSILAVSLKPVFTKEIQQERRVRGEIIALLQKWPKDFNAKNLSEVCGLFAPDVVASYQGDGDKNYAELCSRLKKAMASEEKTFTYRLREIEQMIVGKELAAVRLIWTLEISSKDGKNREVIREKGLDIFQKQPDGSWKIAISYAYSIDH